MTAHKHAHLMAQYAQDWAETDEPWKRWEVAAYSNMWRALCSHPSWNEEYEYRRRKPRTITYTVTMPEPMREAPGVGEAYYVAAPDAAGFCIEYVWAGRKTCIQGFKRGLCFSTREDAIAAAKAMMPIKVEEA